MIIAAATFEREYRYGVIYSVSSIIVICVMLLLRIINFIIRESSFVCIHQGSFFLICELFDNVCQYNSSEAIRESDSAKLIGGQEKVSEIRSWEVLT